MNRHREGRTLYENSSVQAPPKPGKKQDAVVVLGSAANPPHAGHLGCLGLAAKKAEELGYNVLFGTIAAAPQGYVESKMERLAEDGTFFQPPLRCFGSALECGRKLRPTEDFTIVVVVGADRCKQKWRRASKDRVVTVCCARDADQLTPLEDIYDLDKQKGLVFDDK